MRTGHKNHPLFGDPRGPYLKFRRPRSRDRYRTVDMKFALTPIVEQPKGHIAVLLKFGNDQPCTDRVYRPGGYEKHVSGRYGSPLQKIRDRPIACRFAQLVRSYVLVQAQGDPRAWGRAQDVRSEEH